MKKLLDREVQFFENLKRTVFDLLDAGRITLHKWSRNESEIKTTRDREEKFQNKSQEFSRIETLTGHCPVTVINDIRMKVQL